MSKILLRTAARWRIPRDLALTVIARDTQCTYCERDFEVWPGLRVASAHLKASLLTSDEPTRDLAFRFDSELAACPLSGPTRGFEGAGRGPFGDPGRPEALEPLRPMADAFDAHYTQLSSAIAFLRHNITELGLPTMEVYARLIIDFPQMPWEFAEDMARQVWDEALHAEVFMQRLEHLGGRVGQYGYTHEL